MTNAECPPSEEIVDEAAGVVKRLEHVRELITVAVLKDAAKGIDLSTEVPIYTLFWEAGGIACKGQPTRGKWRGLDFYYTFNMLDKPNG